MTKILNFALKIKGGWHMRRPSTLSPPKIWNVHFVGMKSKFHILFLDLEAIEKILNYSF